MVVNNKNLAPLASEETLDRMMTPRMELEEPWNREGFYEQSKFQQNQQIYQVSLNFAIVSSNWIMEVL